MAIRILENGNFKNIKLQDLGVEDSVEFTFLFDSPIERPGKFLDKDGNAKLIRAFKVRLHGKLEGEEVGFICPNHTTTEFGKWLPEKLKEYRSGDRVRLTRGESKAKSGRTYTQWKVEQLKDDGSPLSSSEIIIETLMKMSESEKKDEEWVKQKLLELGIKDEPLINKFTEQYNSRWT